MSLLEGILTVLDVSLGDELSRLAESQIGQAVNICDVLCGRCHRALPWRRFSGHAVQRAVANAKTVRSRLPRKLELEVHSAK